MRGFFRFLSCFVGLAVSSSAYGDWPSPKDFINHLLGKSGLYATFRAAFKDVYKKAESSGFKKLQLFGEKSGALEAWKQFELKKYDYNVLQENRGFFSCMVGLINVLNIKNVEKVVEEEFSKDRINRNFMPAVTKICKVLLSEDFARKLLADSFVNKFLASAKESDYSYCSVHFCPVWYSEHDFSFRLQYVQPSSQVRLQFEVDFNVEKCCLEENGEVDIGNNFETQGCFIHSNEGWLSQDDLVAALNKPDKDMRSITVEGVHMKAIRMMTKDANMDDKKSTENPQTEQDLNTQPFSPNPPPTVNNVTEETNEQKVWEQPSGTVPPPEPSDLEKPGPNSPKEKEQKGVKEEEQKSGDDEDTSQQQDKTKKKKKKKNKHHNSNRMKKGGKKK